MGRFVFSLLLLSAILVSFQQKVNTGFNILPKKNLEVTGTTHQEEPATATAYLKTDSKEKQLLRWKIVQKNFPQAWHIYYCDNVSCYFMMPDSSTMRPIQAGQQQDANRMKLYVEPNGIAGEGSIKIAVFEIKNRMNADTITYTVRIK